MTFDLIKGQKCSLTKNTPSLTRIIVGMGWHHAEAAAEVDFSAFLLTSAHTVSKDEDLIYYGNPSASNQSVVLSLSGNKTYSGLTDNGQITVELDQIPAEYKRLAFALTIYEGERQLHNFSQLNDAYIRIINAADGTEFLRYRLGKAFTVETAVIAGEIYRYKNEWKFSAVGSGYAGGLAYLCRSYGLEVIEEDTSVQPESPVNQVQQSATPPPPVNQSTIMLTQHGERINLQKGTASLGEILVTLNWYHNKSSSWFGSKSVKLDLGCLFELKNGLKGSVQALGESYGSLNRPPYISLYGDDRTGFSATGQNLRINGRYLSEISRIVIFAFIYEGVPNWSQADANVTIKQQDSPEIKVRLDEHNNNKGMCAIAMLRNETNETFSVERLAEYFAGHEELDQRYNWNLKWETGSN